uniref:Uncharacterized protein n=1 Tax=Paramoeba aestuarina TaxID=180227 RepID=A0A7S4PMX5_9EUKA|mmetsp:Transcript_9254/g.14039  ORF Transcript_9254/g.14039 Transcript_9254/m.14039 type:complete len:190 (+) Transcript_9254:149-718(+)|eukprot:CAMPEP_0201510992 /NCGR_PEP_ID=MMETSP0161_2-20130828/3512_1 /ASSEMBLY_ACC=CAM_ASM_000251 /TAXON_ID=180227 /ORGANISM="Neoparamoeba aestuarina, Strain SoJaBio B1-5/56/2" /LENGTH=189 /DNA_ID=CAMNT_0047906307 /DNA_START=149 /DNA_END=721 /DNA_ORIENTATION=-
MPKKKEKTPLHKIIIVGDGGVGKSALTLQYMYGDFVEEYDPTSADSYRKKITIEGEETNIDILDTAGQEDYAAMRDNYYRTGEGFICVYSVTRESTFKEVNNFREAILRVTERDSVPFVLVGNKIDLENEREVSKEKGESLAAQFDCKFIETSAKTNTNVDEAFKIVVENVIEAKKEFQKEGKKDCLIQ